MAIFLKYGSLLLISFGFLLLGIRTLMAAYRLNDPHAFILTFFASNFIILISAALFIGLILRLRHRLRACGQNPSQSEKDAEDNHTDCAESSE